MKPIDFDKGEVCLCTQEKDKHTYEYRSQWFMRTHEAHLHIVAVCSTHPSIPPPTYHPHPPITPPLMPPSSTHLILSYTHAPITSPRHPLITPHAHPLIRQSPHQALLAADDKAVLDQVARAIREVHTLCMKDGTPPLIVGVEGHTNCKDPARRSNTFNMRLSAARAAACREYVMFKGASTTHPHCRNLLCVCMHVCMYVPENTT